MVVTDYASLKSMGLIEELAIDVRERGLPAILENQRAFSHIESLRRIAEVVYDAHDPMVRRNARIDAQALAGESGFGRGDGFVRKIQGLSRDITEIAVLRDGVHEGRIQVNAVRQSYSDVLRELVALGMPADAMTAMLTAFFASRVNASEMLSTEEYLGYSTPASLGRDTQLHTQIMAACVGHAHTPELKGLCDKLPPLFSEYLEGRQAILAKQTEAKATWLSFESAVRELRDAINTEAEKISGEHLQIIEGAAVKAKQSALALFAVTLAVFAGFFIMVHQNVVQPLRWTTRKLCEIQQGNLHIEMPPIHIKEIGEVAALLDRFSAHLSDLYSRASQWEEDAANKREIEEIMRAVFQASPDGYAIWDKGNISQASPGLLKLLGVADMAELLLRWAELGLPELGDRLRAYAKVMENQYLRQEYELRTSEGRALPCESTQMRIDLPGRELILEYLRDMRQQKQHEEALRQAKEAAEVAAQAKSEFLARMSHEIRTPMNGVLGLTHVALQKSPAPEQRHYLMKIQASARILLGVINDILDFSKIEHGKLELDTVSFSLRETISNVHDLLHALAEDKGIVFFTEVTPSVPDTLQGDALRLSQVLMNLCGNALKFTEKGQVTLRVVLEGMEEDTVCLGFYVEDTGVGMTEEQLEHLFQPFSQADVSITRKYGGTGLGLAISHLLVDAMGGAIHVRSTFGEGSEFSFGLPFALGEQEDVLEPLHETQEAVERLRGQRVLLVEDNEINQEIARSILENLGLVVTTADNGAEALEALEEDIYDGVLMDIQMPVMDGLMAARAIRKLEDRLTREVPIIAMTAHAMREDKEKSLQAGMNDHITKPIDVNKLQRKLCRWLLSRSRS